MLSSKKEKGKLSMAGQVVVTGSLLRGQLMAAGSLWEQRDMSTDMVLMLLSLEWRLRKELRTVACGRKQ